MPNASMMHEVRTEKIYRRRSDGMIPCKDNLSSKVRCKDQLTPPGSKMGRSASDEHARTRSRSVCLIGHAHSEIVQNNHRNQPLLHMNSISPAPDLQGAGMLGNASPGHIKYQRRNSASPMFTRVVTQRRESPTALNGKQYRRASTSFEPCYVLESNAVEGYEKENEMSNRIQNMLCSGFSCSSPPPFKLLQVIANGIMPGSHPRQTSLYGADSKQASLTHLLPRNRFDWAGLESEEEDAANRKATEFFKRVTSLKSGKPIQEVHSKKGAKTKAPVPEDLSEFDFIHIVAEKNIDD
eukprot:751163-Hanusia_phi.AAC.1